MRAIWNEFFYFKFPTLWDSINAAKYTREPFFVDLRQAVAVLTSELDRTVTVLEYSFACSKESAFSFFSKSVFYLGSTVQCTISPFFYASFCALSHPLKTFNPFKTSFNDWITSLKDRINAEQRVHGTSFIRVRSSFQFISTVCI